MSIEACGAPPLSEETLQLFSFELARYPEMQVLRALTRCVREVTGRLSLANIISRIDDGRPSADEAWAAVGLVDENRTFVATSEALEALATCYALLERDEVAARMAFKKRYEALIIDARGNGAPVKWIVSLGHDKAAREAPVRMAIEQGLISEVEGRDLVPALPAAASGPATKLIAGLAEVKALPAGPAPELVPCPPDILQELLALTGGR